MSFYTPAVNVDTLYNLFRRLITGADNPTEVVIELLLIGVSVNWCAGVLHGTRGTRLLRGLLVLFIAATLFVQMLAAALDWPRLELLYRFFIIGLALIALVAFQPELRRALIRAGDVRFLRRIAPRDKMIAALIEASGYLSRNKYGALIAIQREIGLANWAENGAQLNADVSADVLKSIFYPNSPLHDLGVVVRGNKVLAASCQFPVAESGEVDSGLGSRHRAAVGLSSESDALVLIVSEETGTVSLADRGELLRYLSLDDLEEELQSRLSGTSFDHRRRRSLGSFSDLWRFTRRLLLVAPLTLLIWFLADQASMRPAEGIEVALRLEPGPNRAVGDVVPQRAIFTLGVRGSTRAVEALRSASERSPIELAWTLGAPYNHDGPHALTEDEFRGVLEDLLRSGRHNVDVESVAPETLRFSVDAIAMVNLPVRVDGGSYLLSGVRIEPAEVGVALRNGDLARLAADDRVVTARIADRLGDVPPGESRTFERVALEPAIGSVELLALEPDGVRVTLEVVAQEETRRLEQVGVQLSHGPQVLDRVDVETRDLNEWLIALEVVGEKSKISGLQPDDVSAYVEITAEDTAVATPDFRSFNVSVVLPAGIELVGSAPTVHLRFVAREGTSP